MEDVNVCPQPAREGGLSCKFRTELMPLESRQLFKRVRDYDDLVGLERWRTVNVEMEEGLVDMYIFARFGEDAAGPARIRLWSHKEEHTKEMDVQSH